MIIFKIYPNDLIFDGRNWLKNILVRRINFAERMFSMTQGRSFSYGDLTQGPRTNFTEDELVLELSDESAPVDPHSTPVTRDECTRPPPLSRNNSNTSNLSALSNSYNEESALSTSVHRPDDDFQEHNHSMNSPLVDRFDEPCAAKAMSHAPFDEPCEVKDYSKKKGISSRFKAKLFPGKQLPKKRVNNIKKVVKYVNSLSVNSEFIEERSVTPVFDQEEDLKTDDFIQKRNEYLNKKSCNFMDLGDEVIILDIPDSQDDHIEAAMERRQALLRHREEKKNSLKLEGILEESPQSSPKHRTLPTPEDYEDYLDAEVVQDYPELATTPAGLLPEFTGEKQSGNQCSYPSEQPEEGRHYSERLGRSVPITGSTSMVFMDEQSSPSVVAGIDLSHLEAFRSNDRMICREFLNNVYCRSSLPASSVINRARSLSDSHDSSSSHNPVSTSTLKSIKSISSYESQTYSPVDHDYSNNLAARDSIARCSIGSTSGYSSMSFDSSSTGCNKKKATLFLPTITTSLPEISLQPPTPQAPKPKPSYENDKVKYDLKAPGFRSMFLTVPGSEDDDSDKYLPGNASNGDEYGEIYSSDSSDSCSEDDDVIHKPRMLSPMSLLSSHGGLRRFGSSCDISSLGLNIPSIGTDQDDEHVFEDDDEEEESDTRLPSEFAAPCDDVQDEFLEYKASLEEQEETYFSENLAYSSSSSRVDHNQIEICNVSYKDESFQRLMNTEIKDMSKQTGLRKNVDKYENRHSSCEKYVYDSNSFNGFRNTQSGGTIHGSYENCSIFHKTNANNNLPINNLKCKIGGTGSGSFVASKLAIFEKVAENRQLKYNEQDIQSRRNLNNAFVYNMGSSSTDNLNINCSAKKWTNTYTQSIEPNTSGSTSNASRISRPQFMHHIHEPNFTAKLPVQDTLSLHFNNAIGAINGPNRGCRSPTPRIRLDRSNDGKLSCDEDDDENFNYSDSEVPFDDSNLVSFH